jgi:hypothetical protein
MMLKGIRSDGNMKTVGQSRAVRVIAEHDVTVRPGIVLSAGVYPGRTTQTARRTEYFVRMTVSQLVKAGDQPNLFGREFLITALVQSGDVSLDLPTRSSAWRAG